MIHKSLSVSFIQLLSLSFISFSSALVVANTTVSADGSSTVFPITEAMAEEFGSSNKNIRVTVGVSGTGGGFRKFLSGEVDIANASRHIKPEEAEIALKKKVEYLEIPVAYDGIAVVVNSKNTWAKDITADELKKIWAPNSTVKTWKDIRTEWPAQPIKLYGPGTDSGTFDYFTEAINGKAQLSRSDFVKSEDDNVLVKGVAGDVNAMGYFGFAYYIENSNKVKALGVIAKPGAKAVLPSVDSISKLEYLPLSRKVFIYASKTSSKKPEVKKFIEFYLNKASEKQDNIVKEVGYIPLSQKEYASILANFQNFSK